MRATELLAWLKERKGRVFTMKMLDRMGFFDEVYTEVGDVVHEYDICRIVFDGERYWASSKESGGMKTFWPCVYYALEINAACTLEGESIFGIGGIGPKIYCSQVNLTRSAERRALIKDALDRFCVSHPRGSVRISLVGSRGPSACLMSHHVRSVVLSRHARAVPPSGDRKCR